MSATSVKTVFYQWQKERGYPVFLRMSADMLEGRLQKLITDLGFQEVPEADHRKISVQRAGTRVLTLSRASARVSRQVSASDEMDRYGAEVLSFQGNAQIYLCRRIGLMVFSPTTTLWELGLASHLETTEELMGFRVMLNRYLAWALASYGVIGFWGVATAEGFVAMKQSQSFGEAVFVDVEKRQMYSSAGTVPLVPGLSVLRADKAGPVGRKLGAEELVSFLGTHNIHLSHGIMPAPLKRATILLGTLAHGEWGGHVTSPDGLSNA